MTKDSVWKSLNFEHKHTTRIFHECHINLPSGVIPSGVEQTNNYCSDYHQNHDGADQSTGQAHWWLGGLEAMQPRVDVSHFIVGSDFKAVFCVRQESSIAIFS